MKKLLLYLFMIAAVSVTACKGKSKSDNNTADTAQTHLNSQNPADTTGLPTTPVETGGQDTSGQGAGTTNAPKDTLKSNTKK